LPSGQRPEVEVLLSEAELVLELIHALFQLHEAPAEPLDPLVGQVAGLDEREDEVPEPAREIISIGPGSSNQTTMSSRGSCSEVRVKDLGRRVDKTRERSRGGE
jgi:hypothetical protein